MKPDRTMIELPHDLTQRCRSWGERAAASGKLRNRFSSRGAESDPIKLTDSKIAECIFALHVEMDIDAIHSPEGASWDVRLDRTLVDIKQTSLRSRYLIWPATKVDDFENRNFHVLASVKTDVKRAENGDIISASGLVRGWIGKKFFRMRKQIAGPNHLLDEGTWYVPEDVLQRMGVFPGFNDDEREHYCWCGEWGDFGFNVSLRQNKLGVWFCRDHRPKPEDEPKPFEPPVPAQGELF